MIFVLENDGDAKDILSAKILSDVAISKAMAEQRISEPRFVSADKVIAACI